MKVILPMILLATALCVPLTAQTLTEQLEKAIYTEESLRNPEEAAKLYRQIIAAAAVPRLIAQEAERRLARLTAAKQVAGASGARIVNRSSDRPDHGGAVEQGRYRNFATGITFAVLPGWTASETYASSDSGQQISLTDQTTKRSINVWMIKEDIPAPNIAERLAGAPDEKLRQRHSGYRIPGMEDAQTYEIPPETVKRTMINGREAIVAVGNYRGIPPERFLTAGGRASLSSAPQPMNEYMTWIYTERSRAFYFARAPVGDLPQLRRSVEQLVNSAVIP